MTCVCKCACMDTCVCVYVCVCMYVYMPVLAVYVVYVTVHWIPTPGCWMIFNAFCSMLWFVNMQGIPCVILFLR